MRRHSRRVEVIVLGPNALEAVSYGQIPELEHLLETLFFSSKLPFSRLGVSSLIHQSH